MWRRRVPVATAEINWLQPGGAGDAVPDGRWSTLTRGRRAMGRSGLRGGQLLKST